MLPVIAIVGRPNVGKSTLFNALTRSRSALVADQPGVTRDRLYGRCELTEQAFIVIDTGGLNDESSELAGVMEEQTLAAIQEADQIIFMVDGRGGLTSADQAIAQQLRLQAKPIHLAVNKSEGRDGDIVSAEFHSLGLTQPLPIAAAHGYNINLLLETIQSHLPSQEVAEISETDAGIKIAIIGRPNVGKSTLVNRLLGEERVVVYDMPGTTRDSIYIPFTRQDKTYTLIDTAGVRRRAKISETIEKFSVIKTLQAIEASHVVILVLDAHEGISEQDLSLLGFTLTSGRALIIAVNKWDGLASEQRLWLKRELDRRLDFVDFAMRHFISALHGTGVGELLTAVNKVYHSATKKLPTPELTRILTAAVAAHQPPLVHGRRIKLRYAHAGGHNPPIVVIHGTQANALPEAYRRYLANYFRQTLHLTGTPVRIELREGTNPYAHRKNQLTTRQIRKKQRLMRHIKSRK